MIRIRDDTHQRAKKDHLADEDKDLSAAEHQ
jgi:hypothetical protein